jgi:hypothetical protein
MRTLSWRRSLVAEAGPFVTCVGFAAVLGTGDDLGADWLSCHETRPVDRGIGRRAIGL